MAIDSTSALIGAAVGVGAILVLGGKKSSSGKKSGKKKGLGSTYVVSGTAKKVTKRAGAVRKAAGGMKRRKATAKK